MATSAIDGIETNLAFVAAAIELPDFVACTHTTATLAEFRFSSPRLEVVRPGTQTTVQAWPGRQGFWDVGVPPSGPMDDRSFRWGNRALGNDEGAPGIEATLVGPSILCTADTWVCVTGAPTVVTVDGEPVPMWAPVQVPRRVRARCWGHRCPGHSGLHRL